MKKDEHYSILDDKFKKWFDDPDQGYIPTPEAEAKHLKQRRHRSYRRHAGNPEKLLEALIIGIVAVFFCGLCFYLFILFPTQ